MEEEADEAARARTGAPPADAGGGAREADAPTTRYAARDEHGVAETAAPRAPPLLAGALSAVRALASSLWPWSGPEPVALPRTAAGTPSDVLPDVGKLFEEGESGSDEGERDDDDGDVAVTV